MRVLYDISMLGLGEVSVHLRGGSYRADRHITETLIAAGECDLLFCANHSSLAYEGCIEYLRAHPTVGHVPLVRHRNAWSASRLRAAMVSAHRRVKMRFPGHALPRLMRASATLVDSRIHPAVTDALPPVQIHHSSAIPLPARRLNNGSPRRFLTIYDLRCARFNGNHAEASYQRAALGSLRKDDWVMTSSESTRNELCEHGVRPQGIFVSPLAADPSIFRPCTETAELERTRSRYGIPPGHYLLIMNSLEPRKNVTHAVRAFINLARQERIQDLSLVLFGNSAAGSGQVLEVIEPVAALRQRVINIGYVVDEDLAALYSGALAFVYPSTYEGFGLPPLEAMQCGTPVITSNTSSLPEVVGDAGLMVDPHDQEALCAAMLALYRDASLRESVRRKCLGQAARFSWKHSAQRTLAAYRAAMSA
jgi:glycosyltransferase involved in cell wall biosynthesis